MTPVAKKPWPSAHPARPGPILQLSDLRIPDLDPLSLSLHPGRVIGFSGRSGSGKTRLLWALADMDPHQGNVSLDGMMTGQILAGSPPSLAVKYQILIMFGIILGSGFGTLVAVLLASRRLFDKRQRLRLCPILVSG